MGSSVRSAKFLAAFCTIEDSKLSWLVEVLKDMGPDSMQISGITSSRSGYLILYMYTTLHAFHEKINLPQVEVEYVNIPAAPKRLKRNMDPAKTVPPVEMARN